MESIKWSSPSNIALIKYWGKKGHQIPANPSLCFTLDKARTEMSLSFEPSSTSELVDLEFFFEGEQNPGFEDKIRSFLNSLLPYELPFLKELRLKIESENTFPHSTGIASSASSMSALALCLASLESHLMEKPSEGPDFLRKASYLARLGSGSAARSVYGGVVTWGAVKGDGSAFDEYATPLTEEIDPVFQSYHDSVLIVSKEQKSVSSRQGHALMQGHPFADTRYEQAENNLKLLLNCLKDGNLESFAQVVENEALSLHGLMLSSNPGVILIKGPTLELINKVRTFRKESGLPVCFTLDAGPNVHLLYPHKVKDDVDHFINQELIVYCADNYWIKDNVGAGPVRLN